jgi:hypothetical protein
MWRKISLPAAAVAVVSVLLLAGCGKGDETTSAGAQPAPGPTTVVPTTVTTVPATTSTTAAPACPTISFSSNPDDKASDIKTVGVSCTEAEPLIRNVGAQVKGEGGPAKVESGDGYTCLRVSARAGDHGPGSAIFECTNGAKKVTFTRT